MIELLYKIFPSRRFEKKVKHLIFSNSCVHPSAVFMFQIELKNKFKHLQNNLFSMVIGSCHDKVQYFLKTLSYYVDSSTLSQYSNADITVKFVTSNEG